MKQTKLLGVLGGEPFFSEKLHVGRPNIGNQQQLIARFSDILDRNWLSNGGPCVKELEHRLEEYLDVQNCVLTTNATIGLEIAARAANLSGEVIVPAFTFVATAHAFRWMGLEPVFCDVEKGTHNIDPKQAEELITPRTSAIVGVHLWGRPCDVASLEHLAAKYDLTLMFDAAHAFGCTHKGRHIGNFGKAEIFSFHATKFFNTLEGGAIVTNDDEFANKARLMKNFGFSGYDQVSSLGTNGKMNEMSAAMGLTSLESLGYFVETNKRNYLNYETHLERIDGINLISIDSQEESNFQYIVAEVDEAVTGLSRDELVEVLWAENVMARRYFTPGVHLMEPYKTNQPGVGARLPVTERLSRNLLVLPTGTAVAQDQIENVVDILENAISNADDVQKAILSR